ncbi:MAG TPA: Cof-type HAD-IIB family hydrolase [Acidobacteriota bacterium]|jgi:hypothetical protein|nr:Cof-type HAD-IIB family hydrolase [Acidobacteriota bacterium]
MRGSEIRLVALDLDGTFLDNQHQVSPANARAVEILRRNGVRIVLVTGRRFRNVARIAQQYGLGDLAIVHNGALIRSSDSGEVLYFKGLEPDVFRQLIDFSRKMKQFPFVHVDPRETRIFFQEKDQENPSRSEYIARNRADMVAVDDLMQALAGPPVIQMMFTHAIAPLERFKAMLKEQFSFQTAILETSYPDRDHIFVDVIHALCSKGKALAWLMERENLAPCQVMAFGDNHNDLEMLQVAGHSFLMDNATEDLKRHGFRIAPRNDADGVARIVDEYWNPTKA